MLKACCVILLNINSATIQDLEKIPTLDLQTAKLIINYRNKFGKFFSTGEIYSVKGINSEEAKIIIPFITISVSKHSYQNKISQSTVPTIFLRNSSLSLRSRTIRNLQKTKKYSANGFKGSPYKIYNRFLYTFNDNYELGFLTEKDPGERSFNDFTSFHVYVKHLGIFTNIAVGDYLMEFGQGLALWNSYGFSKGSDAIYPVKKNGDGVKPYTSTDENQFFRGISAASKFGNIKLTAFYSSHRFDANIDSATNMITSTPLTGYHRNKLELSRKKTGKENFYGFNFHFSLNDNVNAGALYYHSSFNDPFSPKGIFDKTGRIFNYYSLYYDVILNKFDLFGEFSYDGKSTANINGLIFQANHDFVFAASIRSYPRNYINLHGFGFGEKSGKTQDEFGVYTGLKWRTSFGTINFYFDQFNFPFPAFRDVMPSRGNEFLLKITSKPIKSFTSSLRFKYEKKYIPSELNTNKVMLQRLRRSIREEILYNVFKSIRLKERFELNYYNIDSFNPNEKGFLFFQGLRYERSNRFIFYGRIIFFKTDSFNSAIYEYENNIKGILANIPLYGEGMRWYALITYKLLSHYFLSCKYSETVKFGKTPIASGGEILDNRISIQLDINL